MIDTFLRVLDGVLVLLLWQT